MSPPNDTDDNPTETTTLLSPQPLSPSSSPSPSATPRSPSPTTNPPFHRFYHLHLSPLWSVLLTVASLGSLCNMGVNIAHAPSLAILQGIICRNYYEKGVTDGLGLGLPTNFEDDRCKIGPVQSEVAEVSAWKDVWEVLPAVIMAIPFGIITDRIGRKKVLLLALFGMLLNEVWIRLIYGFPDFFPVRAVWLGGLFQAIGGGSTTFTSIAYVLVADVCPAEERSTVFGYLLAPTIISRFLFVPIGGALISINPWIAMSLGFLLEIVGFFVAVVFVHETFPNTPNSEDASASGAESQPTLIGGEETNGFVTREEEEEEEMAKKQMTVKQRVESYLETAKKAGNWTAQNPKVVLLLLCFGLYMMGEQAEMLLMIQYASKRLGWSLGKASLLPSLGALTNLSTLLFLLPFLSSLLSTSSPYPSFQMSELRKDTLLAQLFAFCLALGSLFIALPIPKFAFLASGEMLYSAGTAVSVPLRSLITNLVDSRHRATLYTVISVFTYGAVSVGRPVAAGLFSAGLRMGDNKGDGDGMEWMGLPYLVAAGMFAVLLGVVSLGGFGRGRVRGTVEEEEEGGVQGERGEGGEGEEEEGERYRD